MHKAFTCTVQTNEYGTEIMFMVEDGHIQMKIFNLTGDRGFDYPFEELNLNTLHEYGVNIHAAFSYIAVRYEDALCE